MSNPLPGANVIVDIYRGANPSSPYPSGTPAVRGVAGTLQPFVRTGRHGSASWLKWTHILILPLGTDVRDAYNSQLDPSRNHQLADTIVLTDSTVGSRKVAYFVVFVEKVGTQLRVYLDRFQPSAWPTDAL